MKLTVQSYQGEGVTFHECVDPSGKLHRIDLDVDDPSVLEGNGPEWLVGKAVEVDRTIPYVSIGLGVKIVKSEGGAS